MLSTVTVGETGSWVVFCHGLFGQGKNWTGVAKALASGDGGRRHRSLLVDMPDHGRSPWSDRFDYVAMADQVAATVRELDEPVGLVGHSMGGKVAMLLALRHPELVDRLVVVDVSPSATDARAGFATFVEAMRGVDLSRLERRSEAVEQMRQGVPDDVVRGFLLQNLRHDPSAPHGQQWRWQMNLPLLGDELEEVGAWPAQTGTYEGPVLWVGGDRSPYVSDREVPAMTALFPRVRRVTVKDAGHWVHSEQPEVFVAVLRHFLDG